MGSTPTARTRDQPPPTDSRHVPRPRLYLDVDGVLNVLAPAGTNPGADSWDDLTFHEQVPSHAGAFDLRLSKQMVAEVAALEADVAWLTTWRSDAVAEVAPLVDAPDWPWLDWQDDKTEAVVTDQRRMPRPFVWIDDMAATRHDVHVVAAQLEVPLPVHLLIRPSPTVGLRQADIARIRTFLATHG